MFYTTNVVNKSYDFLPSKYIYEFYEENALIKLMNLQIEQKKKGSTKNCFVIFDDCIGTIDFNSQVLRRLFTTYRQYNIQLIFTTQYIYAIPPILRSCIIYFITFNQQQKRSVQAIFETFMTEFENYDECKRFIYENCQDYFILIKTQEPKERKYIISAH